MPISIDQLAKKLAIAPEAVRLHAMDLEFEIADDDLISDEIAQEIEKIETSSEIAQVEHEIEEELDREIIEKQAQKTAGSTKKIQKKKEEQKKKNISASISEEEKPEKKSPESESKDIILPESVTVRELAERIGKPIPLVLVKLKDNGIIANLKQELDYETAAIIAQEMGIVVKRETAQLSGEQLFRGNLEDFLKEEDPSDLKPRPPVISIMGHVDHGKTSLLDYIRKTNVVEGESGGITQKIGAYRIEHQGKKITFLDTPGHEAFTAMRARGARATDIAVLVVAATEGLKPQSVEAINHAKEARIPIVVAVNKMDLPGADPEIVKRGLSEQELVPEDWGGNIPCVPVSAKKGGGISDLLDHLLLIAESKKFSANPHRSAIATVIESEVNKHAGINATVVINTGTLKLGDAFVIYDQYGKVRSMYDENGQKIKTAEPSTPVKITGFDHLPQAGDLFQVVANEKKAREKAEEVASIHHEDQLQNQKKFSIAALKSRIAEGRMNQVKLLVKAEMGGSLEAVSSECEKVKTEKSNVKVVHSAVGEVTESDILLAAASGLLIVAFHLPVSSKILKKAEQMGVEILSFEVIYHLSERLQEILEGRDDSEKGEQIIGNFSVIKSFASNKKMAVLGGSILDGVMKKNVFFRQFREMPNEETGETETTLLGSGKVESVHRGSENVAELSEEGLECGLKLEHDSLKFKPSDRLELFSRGSK